MAFLKRPVLMYQRKQAFPSGAQANSARIVDQNMADLGLNKNDSNVH